MQVIKNENNKTGVIRNVDNEKQTVLFTPILRWPTVFIFYE